MPSPERVPHRRSTLAAEAIAVIAACGLGLWLAARPAAQGDRTAPPPTELRAQPAAAPASSMAAPPAPPPGRAAGPDTAPSDAPSHMPSAASPPPPLSPRPQRTPAEEEVTDADRMRLEGERVLEEALDHLTGQTDAVVEAWRSYEDACAGKAARATILAGPSAGRSFLESMEDTPACRDRRAVAESLAAGVRSRFDEAKEAARRARVLPGRVRDLEHQYGFDSEFWQQ